ncbi:Indolepyruvate ferredoxin oxidoreductase [Acidovorax delafieldii 2AN]|uniref:Indolepyruvate ferredoxin oxidoreductase n=1 Tax=Acidovorax delafieldii 2AN TaxID=573060 RepID=C5T0A3_ACIDE|nr:indolepyruvate ferredoxin oxidoreductase family protein [Acidovorax delafieldii]EER62056.1 Indolepyruvate ferredoxin oxidoreductase [Acidovorax delafieldii 2AN]
MTDDNTASAVGTATSVLPPLPTEPMLADLSERYTRESGVVFMSGNQALVRLPLQQRMRDQREGLRTAGFISGYRGSPLGRFDMELWQAGKLLKQLDIHFQPGVNEDLAATAVWGTQYVPILPGPRVDGVFGIWYGKGPGVDRSGDAFKHANAAGTSALGGVLALAGDDHAAKSSTQAHQSEQAFVAAGIPVLYPSNVQEILDYGQLGLAMSRYAGCWVALKLVTDVVEGSGSVRVGPDSPSIVLPPESGGLTPDRHIKRFEPAPMQEARLYQQRLPAALAFARANRLNRIEGAGDGATVGIVSAGKSWSDTQLALDRLEREGVMLPRARLRLLKVGMVWPLDADIVTHFARGLDSLLVVEEKRPLLEDQIKSILFDAGGEQPSVHGKFHGAGIWSSQRGAPALPLVGELSPSVIAAHIAAWLGLQRTAIPALVPTVATPTVDRAPTFCSGCPHSTSTRVPDGSLALAGIGCHSIALLLDTERTGPISHMGAEGAMWVGQSPFSEHKHMFANIGDGTYYHSGFLAIRQAVAAKVNITYKLLLNGFVSMTGGQPIEGELTPAQLATELLAEGVARVVVVTDDPNKYSRQRLPDGVPVHHRERMDAVQRELREHDGVSVLIYDQMCATERRRQRKRGNLPDPHKRTFINPAVCEGCGDCSEESNCLSIEPLQTELGRKRRINQASCNKDFSCVKGFCPSFVTVQGGKVRSMASGARPSPYDIALPEPEVPVLDGARGVIVTGIGGTGVITVGAIITMAAHLEGIHASSLDLTGLAQKYGAVMSHIRLARHAEDMGSYRLGLGEADLILGCDLIVTASTEAVDRMAAARTRVVLNTDLAPTRDFARNPDWSPDTAALQARVAAAACDLVALPAGTIATDLMGDPLTANLFVLGLAWQKGWVPISRSAIERAIRLNGVSVDTNLASFAWGRVAAHDPARIESARSSALGPSGHGQVLRFEPAPLQRLQAIIDHRSQALTQFQNAAYAQRYRTLVERVAQAERRVAEAPSDERLAKAVARYYYKLLAYKDEYEVARLYSAPEFVAELKRTFEGDFKLHFHLGAGPFARRDPDNSDIRKSEVGPWVWPLFHVLARLRFLRGTWLDPFRRSEERHAALAAIAQYESDVERVLAELDAGRISLAAEIASLPETLRGYGYVRAASAKKTADRRDELWALWATADLQAA